MSKMDLPQLLRDEENPRVLQGFQLRDNVILEVRREPYGMTLTLQQGTTILTAPVTVREAHLIRDAPAARYLREKIQDLYNGCGDDIMEHVLKGIHEHSPSFHGFTGAAPDEDESRKAQKDQLLTIGQEELTFLKDRHGELYACVPVSGHVEIYGVTKPAFSLWLRRAYYTRYQKGIGGEAIRDATLMLHANAIYNRNTPVRELYNRVGRDGEAFYYDLCNLDWQVVKITPDGWTVETDHPMIFTRYQHMQAQCLPLDPAEGDIDVMQPIINLANLDEFYLLKVYMVASLVPGIPHPILVVTGPQGSCKSSMMKMLRQLMDPSSIGLLSFNYKDEETVLTLQQHYGASFDNVTYIPNWLSDRLCRAVTGDGFTKRKLYTDAESVIFSFRRVIALNGITPGVSKPDLLDRSIILELQRIPDSERKEESEIKAAFDAIRPRVFTGMLNALSGAMRIFPDIHVQRLPRMADFAKWGEAISQAMGYPHGQFIQTYTQLIGEQNLTALEQNPVGLAILRFMETHSVWEGAPSALHAALEQVAETHNIDTKNKAWPKGSRWLSKRIKQVEANLRDEGIRVMFGRGRKRIITLTLDGSGFNDDNDATSRSPPTPRNIRESRDINENSNVATPPVNDAAMEDARQQRILLDLLLRYQGSPLKLGDPVLRSICEDFKIHDPDAVLSQLTQDGLAASLGGNYTITTQGQRFLETKGDESK